MVYVGREEPMRIVGGRVLPTDVILCLKMADTRYFDVFLSAIKRNVNITNGNSGTVVLDDFFNHSHEKRLLKFKIF